jgi:hypothetical protein
MAMMCSAWLSWRSPPRSSRCRSRWPEEQGIGAVPVWRAKLASLANRWAPAVRPISSAAVSAPQPVSASSCGRCALTRDEQLALERVRLAAQHAELRDLLARDPYPGAGGQPTQASIDPAELTGIGERAAPKRALEFGAELQQMPAQPVLHPGALGDEILAVIGEQPDLHRALIEVRGGKALHAVLDHRPGDRERVDLIRLARLALPAPGSTHPVRSDADDQLPGRDQRLLEPPRDVPAVLDRPDAFLIQPTRPAHRRQMARLLGLDLAGAALAARPRVDRRQRVPALVRVRPDHDHLHRPFVWLSTDEADLRRTTVTGGDATLLSSHAEGPRAAAGDTSFAGQTRQTTQASRVSPPPAREPTGRVGRHRPTRATLTVTGVC